MQSSEKFAIQAVHERKFSGIPRESGLFAVVVDVDLEGTRGLGKDAIELDEAPPGHGGVEDGQDAAITVKVQFHMERFDRIFGNFSDSIVSFGLFHPGDIDLPEAAMRISKDSGTVAGPEDAQKLLRDVVPAFEIRGPYGDKAVQVRMIVIPIGIVGDFEAAHDAFEGALKVRLRMKRVIFGIEAVAKERATAPVKPITMRRKIDGGTVWERKRHVEVSETLGFKVFQDVLCLAINAEASAPLAHGAKAVAAKIGADKFALLIEFKVCTAFPDMAGAILPARNFLHGRSDKSGEFLVFLESF